MTWMWVSPALVMVSLWAALVSLVGLWDAKLTWTALRHSDRASDIDANRLANSGVRTAFLRLLQMLLLLSVSLMMFWDVSEEARRLLLMALAFISALKEGWAIYDRHMIRPLADVRRVSAKRVDEARK